MADIPNPCPVTLRVSLLKISLKISDLSERLAPQLDVRIVNSIWRLGKPWEKFHPFKLLTSAITSKRGGFNSTHFRMPTRW